jgi:hypothetical protein
MDVGELSVLHRRYVDLSHRFRASWVFHQFAQSLYKVFDGGPRVNHAEDFQALYARLKEVSQGLTASEAERTRQRLDEISAQLQDLTRALVDEDSKVPPEQLRQFFHRFPRYDDKILFQLSRFLIYAAARDGWSPERLDKIDFLLTRAGQQEVDGPERFVLMDRRQLREVLESLWGLTGSDPPPAQEVAEQKEVIDAVRREITSIESLDELNESGVLDRYRGLKHELGSAFLEPELLLKILETNLVFKNLVRRFYRKEERRIVADYQRIFELEAAVPLDVQMERELTEFRKEIERFERRLQQDDFRLGDLAHIRGRVRDLLPRLQRASSSQASAYETPDTAPIRAYRSRPETEGLEGHVADESDELSKALSETEAEDSPRSVCLKPEIFPLGLEPREVVAWRRVDSRDEEAYDLELESFVFQTAALRLRLKRLAEEVQELLDDTARDWEAPVYGKARKTLEVAGDILWRFHHRVFQLVHDGRAEDARFIEVSRMRLMREYAGLWLLVYKPYLDTVPEG